MDAELRFPIEAFAEDLMPSEVPREEARVYYFNVATQTSGTAPIANDGSLDFLCDVRRTVSIANQRAAHRQCPPYFVALHNCNKSL